MKNFVSEFRFLFALMLIDLSNWFDYKNKNHFPHSHFKNLFPEYPDLLVKYSLHRNTYNGKERVNGFTIHLRFGDIGKIPDHEIALIFSYFIQEINNFVHGDDQPAIWKREKIEDANEFPYWNTYIRDKKDNKIYANESLFKLINEDALDVPQYTFRMCDQHIPDNEHDQKDYIPGSTDYGDYVQNIFLTFQTFV